MIITHFFSKGQGFLSGETYVLIKTTEKEVRKKRRGEKQVRSGVDSGTNQLGKEEKSRRGDSLMGDDDTV